MHITVIIIKAFLRVEYESNVPVAQSKYTLWKRRCLKTEHAWQTIKLSLKFSKKNP